MTLRALITLTAALELVSGLLFILVPEQLTSIYGLLLDPTGAFLTRLFGSAAVGLGLVLWLTRDALPETQRKVAFAVLGWLVVEVVVLLEGQLGGIVNALGWMIVALDVVLGVAFTSLLVARSDRKDIATSHP